MGPERNDQQKEAIHALGVGAYLVKDTTIVRGEIMGVEEEAFLYFETRSAVVNRLARCTRTYVA